MNHVIDLILTILIAMFSFYMGVQAGNDAAKEAMANKYQRQAVEHGFAHYDATTGLWQWNEPTATEPPKK